MRPHPEHHLLRIALVLTAFAGGIVGAALLASPEVAVVVFIVGTYVLTKGGQP